MAKVESHDEAQLQGSSGPSRVLFRNRTQNGPKSFRNPSPLIQLQSGNNHPCPDEGVGLRNCVVSSGVRLRFNPYFRANTLNVLRICSAMAPRPVMRVPNSDS